MKLETLTVKVSKLYELVMEEICKLIVLLVELIVSLEALRNAWIGLLTWRTRVTDLLRTSKGDNKAKVTLILKVVISMNNQKFFLLKLATKVS